MQKPRKQPGNRADYGEQEEEAKDPQAREKERERAREKGRRRVSKKFGVIAAAELVSVFPASCPLPQPVRDCPRSGIKRRTIDGDGEGNESGEREGG